MTDRSLVGPFRLLQFWPSSKNCENIFRAALFLRNNLQMRTRRLDIMIASPISRDGQLFKEMAADLANFEPGLRGVASASLYSLYERIVLERRNLDGFLSQSVSEEWTDTRLSWLAKELVSIDDTINVRKTSKEVSDCARQLYEGSGPIGLSEKIMVNDMAGLGPSSSEVTVKVRHIMERQTAGKSVPIGRSEAATMANLMSGVGSPNAAESMATQQTMGLQPSGGISVVDTKQGSSVALPDNAVSAPSSPNRSSTDITDSENHAIQWTRQQLVAPMQPHVHSPLQESSRTLQLSNQGSPSPSYTKRASSPAPSDTTGNDDRKRMASSVDQDICRLYRNLDDILEKVTRMEMILKSLQLANGLHDHLIDQISALGRQLSVHDRQLSVHDRQLSVHDRQLAVHDRQIAILFDRNQAVDHTSI
ncbi:hypothetical protein EMPS_00096 [Entomortierella parvispora]|uniref:Uncharacterized protein n=1 Tax=Entomortierella parvispora TaxID=205924 RepID=A0A9P3LRN5_9FUNG|nr:hypothetical protein EMPS_00096 [Entomortierella parvispora]